MYHFILSCMTSGNVLLSPVLLHGGGSTGATSHKTKSLLSSLSSAWLVLGSPSPLLPFKAMVIITEIFSTMSSAKYKEY